MVFVTDRAQCVGAGASVRISPPPLSVATRQWERQHVVTWAPGGECQNIGNIDAETQSWPGHSGAAVMAGNKFKLTSLLWWVFVNFTYLSIFKKYFFHHYLGEHENMKNLGSF